MGVKYTRNYNQIIMEMAQAVVEIPDLYHFIEMDYEDWHSMGKREKYFCLKTISDDIIYALGERPFLNLGQGSIYYDRCKNLIRVSNGHKYLHIIHLM